MYGKPLDLLLPEQVSELHRHHIERFADSTVVARRMGERSEIRGRRKNGTEFPAEASISKASVDGEMLFTVIMRDVTQRTLADARLELAAG